MNPDSLTPPVQAVATSVAPLVNPVFVSDLHLAPAKPATLARFARFMHEDAPRYAELVFLGDLFEFWIGDDAAAPARPVLELLAAASARGQRLFFMHGNRDPLLGQEFARVTGGTLIADPIVVDVAGTPTLLAHGDAWCTLDLGYQQFRAMARNPDWQRAVLAKSVAERIAMAQGARSESEAAKSMKSSDIMDVTPEAISEAFAQAGVTRMIHGHTHRPGIHELRVADQRCERWVLPDWEFEAGAVRGGYLDFEAGVPRLVFFED